MIWHVVLIHAAFTADDASCSKSYVPESQDDRGSAVSRYSILVRTCG